MPIEKETLEVIARTYVGTMTSIRGSACPPAPDARVLPVRPRASSRS